MVTMPVRRFRAVRLAALLLAVAAAPALAGDLRGTV
jgi:hypothetical protein